MGLTGGVKSHRLSGQISPYCEKKTSLALRVLRAYVLRKVVTVLTLSCVLYFEVLIQGATASGNSSINIAGNGRRIFTSDIDL